MAYGPMGNFGEVDIETGMPFLRQQVNPERQRRVLSDFESFTTRSHEIAMALAATDGAIIKIVLDQLTNRIRQMMGEDIQCQTLLKILGQLKFEMDVAPVNAANVVRQVMGDEAEKYFQAGAAR